MRNWGGLLKPICAFLAAFVLLTAPLQSALAAREAQVKASSATMRASANGGGKALFVLKKGTRVSVTAVKGNVARVAYKKKTGYILKSYLTLVPAPQAKAAAKAAPAPQKGSTLLRAATVYKKASTASAKLGRLGAGDQVELMQTKGNWAKIRRGSQVGFISKAAFTAPAAKAAATPAPTPTPSGGKAMTTTQNAKLFARASQAAAWKKVVAGTQVTVLAQQGNWYKVRRSGVVGFMLKKAFAEAAPQATQSSYKALKAGASGALVLKLQKQLEALGYLDIVPSGKYAATTTSSVKLFQAAHSLPKTGAANSATQTALYAAGAKRSPILSLSLKPGGTGGNVKRLQMRLRAKGYYKGKVNGKYDAATKAAVSDYQLVAKLTRDGMAGPATLSSLFSSKAPKADPKVIKAATATPAPAAATPAPTKAPKPAATPKPSSASSSKADKVIAAAKAKLGKPYVFGAVGPNSYDCSGLTMYAYKTVGLSLPHSAYLVGYNVGKKVSRNQLKRGDIVCFNTVADSDLSDHVGIYLGGGSFLHASSGQGRVVISSLTGYYARVFSWGRSVF